MAGNEPRFIIGTPDMMTLFAYRLGAPPKPVSIFAHADGSEVCPAVSRADAELAKHGAGEACLHDGDIIIHPLDDVEARVAEISAIRSVA